MLHTGKVKLTSIELYNNSNHIGVLGDLGFWLRRVASCQDPRTPCAGSAIVTRAPARACEKWYSTCFISVSFMAIFISSWLVVQECALSGRDWSWNTGLAGILGLGLNSEPRGNNRSYPETRERARVPMKKIGSRDSYFGLVNST